MPISVLMEVGIFIVATLFCNPSDLKKLSMKWYGCCLCRSWG